MGGGRGWWSELANGMRKGTVTVRLSKGVPESWRPPFVCITMPIKGANGGSVNSDGDELIGGAGPALEARGKVYIFPSAS